MGDKITKVILIGNGGSLKGTNLGHKIDQFDEVVRINEAKTIGWEKDAGTKFTIWCTYNPDKKFKKYYLGYKSLGYSDEEVSDMLSTVKEIWYISPLSQYLHSWNNYNTFYRNLGIKNFTKRIESESTRNRISKIVGHPTTGFILMNILLEMYDKIYIAGFDFLGLREDVPVHHYFTNTKMKKVVKDSVHDFKKEYEWCLEKEKEGCIINLREDSVIEDSRFIGKINNLKYSWEK